MRCFGTNKVHGAKEIHTFEAGQLYAPVEDFEKIKRAAGARAKSPYSRSHFGDPTGAREGWFVRGKAERKMGRFDD